MSCNTARRKLCETIGVLPHVAANLGGGDVATASRVLEDVYDLAYARSSAATIDPAAARGELLRLKATARKNGVTIPKHDRADPSPAQVRAYQMLLDTASAATGGQAVPPEAVGIARSRGVSPCPVTLAPMTADDLPAVLAQGFKWFVDDTFLHDYTVHLARNSRGDIVGYAAFEVTGAGKRQTVRMPYIESRRPGAGVALLDDLKARYARINADCVQWDAVDWFAKHGFREDGRGPGDEEYDAGTFIWRRPVAPRGEG